MEQDIATGDLTCPNCLEKTDSSLETCQHCDHVIPAYLRSTKQVEIENVPEKLPGATSPKPSPSLSLADLKRTTQNTPEPTEAPPLEVIAPRTHPSLAELKSVPAQASGAIAPTPPHGKLARPRMKLHLRRSQKAGMTGKVVFILHARVHVSDEMRELIKKYRMGKEVIYAKTKVDISGIDAMGAMRGVATALAARALNLKITVNNLVDGRIIECKDIVEMRAAEDQIKEACEALKSILESAVYFDGEEIIDI